MPLHFGPRVQVDVPETGVEHLEPHVHRHCAHVEDLNKRLLNSPPPAEAKSLLAEFEEVHDAFVLQANMSARWVPPEVECPTLEAAKAGTLDAARESPGRTVVCPGRRGAHASSPEHRWSPEHRDEYLGQLKGLTKTFGVCARAPGVVLSATPGGRGDGWSGMRAKHICVRTIGLSCFGSPFKNFIFPPRKLSLGLGGWVGGLAWGGGGGVRRLCHCTTSVTALRPRWYHTGKGDVPHGGTLSPLLACLSGTPEAVFPRGALLRPQSAVPCALRSGGNMGAARGPPADTPAPMGHPGAMLHSAATAPPPPPPNGDTGGWDEMEQRVGGWVGHNPTKTHVAPPPPTPVSAPPILRVPAIIRLQFCRVPAPPTTHLYSL